MIFSGFGSVVLGVFLLDFLVDFVVGSFHGWVNESDEEGVLMMENESEGLEGIIGIE